MRSEVWRHILNQLFQGAIVDVGQVAPRKERVDPLVHGVPPIVDGGFFEGIALPFGERF